jgi:hypothetical protein
MISRACPSPSECGQAVVQDLIAQGRPCSTYNPELPTGPTNQHSPTTSRTKARKQHKMFLNMQTPSEGWGAKAYHRNSYHGRGIPRTQAETDMYNTIGYCVPLALDLLCPMPANRSQ